MIEVKNLCKCYGDKKAVNDISFSVGKGEILGFLGPNGAGKSTTMNILTGYISSTSGQVLINGVDILEDPIGAKANIGYLPEIPPLYVDMTVDAYLNFMYDLKKCKLTRKAHLKEICDICKISHVRERLIRNLSKGYKQRVGLAQALINNPPVLILDEPTVGLDPSQIIEIRTLIKKLGKNHTVILSSHILPEIQAVCDRIIIFIIFTVYPFICVQIKTNIIAITIIILFRTHAGYCLSFTSLKLCRHITFQVRLII